jgi:hypothetical protein
MARGLISRKMYAQSERRRQNQQRQIRQLRSKMKGNPNLVTIGSVAVGGALPAYLPNFGIEEKMFGVPTEGLIGAGLLYVAHLRDGKPEKKVIEGLAEGMIAVTAYKIALDMSTKG